MKKKGLKTTGKTGVGRPAWVPDAEILKKAQQFGELGLTIDEIAHSLGVGESTLWYKRLEYPELNEAIQRGRANGVATASTVLYEMVKMGNIDAIKTFLKLCHGKTEKAETTLNGKLETNSKVEWIVQPVTPDKIPTTDPAANPTKSQRKK